MAFKLTWLPRVLREAGLKVALVPGWEDRGRNDVGTVQGVLCHHTAGSRTGNMPSLKTLIHGRSDLPGPLAQLGLGRDGTYYVIAAGRCNHAGPGVWKGIRTGNSSFIGIEAENTGSMSDFPWPQVQMDAYHRGVAAILAHIGKGAEFCAAHREYALPRGRKNDPIFDMSAFRATVAELLEAGVPPAPAVPPAEPGGLRRPTLRRGPRDPVLVPFVTQVQRALGVEPAGTFGPRTEAAVRAFQRERGLVADGIVGPRTWEALALPNAPVVAVAPPPVAAPAAPGAVREIPEENRLASPPVDPRAGEVPMPLAEAHAVLGQVHAATPLAGLDPPLARAVQRALAELFLLSPYDGVDGDPGPRTREAWRLFRAADGQAAAGDGIIDPAGAARLIAASQARASFIGTLAVRLGPELEFRRNRRTGNRERSVAAIIQAGREAGLTRAQIAYVLATAEHESDRFAVLEEYASGAAYEGRRDLGNTRPGDGPRYKGRGYVQLTGRNNYAAYATRSGLRLLELPVILMNWPALSVWVLVDGMMRGAYTGRRLDQFVNANRQDFREARRVVNGLDQADRIARQARDWLARLD